MNNPAPSSSSSPFVGTGVNTHGELLPVDALRSIGVRWVRADLNPATPARVLAVMKHYPWPVYWTLSQQEKDIIQAGNILVDAGATDIGLFNEPDGANTYNPIPGVPIATSIYRDDFQRLRQALGDRARLYAPCTVRYAPLYTTACIRGAMPDGIDFHGYGSKDLAADWHAANNAFKLPVIVGEDSGPEGGDAAAWFLMREKQMGLLPWCYYDGPATDARGLFAYDGHAWTIPTPVYKAILATKQPVSSPTS
jgi:hypothetical protein